jgi:hypothetical protein
VSCLLACARLCFLRIFICPNEQIAEYKKLVRGTWSKIEAAGAAPSQAFHRRLNEMDAAVAALFAGMVPPKSRARALSR